MNTDKIKELIIKHCEHRSLLLSDDDFWGSEEDIAMGNNLANETSSIFGYDITEDEEWNAAICKATTAEIAMYAITRLSEQLKSFGGLMSESEVNTINQLNPDLVEKMRYWGVIKG
jgi:hypothetical protein